MRARILDFDDSWEKYLHLVEFPYKNSYQTSIGMEPYKALYGSPCRSPIYWVEAGEPSLLGQQFVRDTSEKNALMRQRILTTHTRQKLYVVRCKMDLQSRLEIWYA